MVRVVTIVIPMNDIKLVIFDIAGTIITDRGEVVHAFGSALKEHGIPYTDAELAEWKGTSKREVIWRFVSRDGSAGDDRVEKIYADFRDILEQHYRDGGVEAIPGAAQTFAWLRERGVRIVTTTGFYREVTDLILERTGWRDLFAANITSSDVSMGRPAPYMIFRAMEAAGVRSVQEVVNIGDTPLDLQAGTNAGVREVIGVLTGLHGRPRLEREPHTALLPSVAELPEWLEARHFEAAATLGSRK
jgi:phosphonatase-like hydrolase